MRRKTIIGEDLPSFLPHQSKPFAAALRWDGKYLAAVF